MRIPEGNKRGGGVYDLKMETQPFRKQDLSRIRQQYKKYSHLVLEAVLGWVLSVDLVVDGQVEISGVPGVGLAREYTGDLVSLLIYTETVGWVNQESFSPSNVISRSITHVNGNGVLGVHNGLLPMRVLSKTSTIS